MAASQEQSPQAIDHAPSQYVAPIPLHNPLWTYVILAINVLVWVAMTVLGSSQDLRVLIRFGAKVNLLIVAGQYWRFVTPMFLHVGLAHLALNTYALYIFGRDVEQLFGRTRFLALYLISGTAGIVASFLGSETVSAGASGAIFGLLGATLVFLAKYRRALGHMGQQQLINLLAITALNLAWGFLGQGIDNLGHIGGLASGLVLGWAYLPRYQAQWSEMPWESPRPTEVQSRWRICAITLAWLAILGTASSLGIRHWRAVYTSILWPGS